MKEKETRGSKDEEHSSEWCDTAVPAIVLVRMRGSQRWRCRELGAHDDEQGKTEQGRHKEGESHPGLECSLSRCWIGYPSQASEATTLPPVRSQRGANTKAKVGKGRREGTTNEERRGAGGDGGDDGVAVGDDGGGAAVVLVAEAMCPAPSHRLPARVAAGTEASNELQNDHRREDSDSVSWIEARWRRLSARRGSGSCTGMAGSCGRWCLRTCTEESRARTVEGSGGKDEEKPAQSWMKLLVLLLRQHESSRVEWRPKVKALTTSMKRSYPTTPSAHTRRSPVLPSSHILPDSELEDGLLFFLHECWVEMLQRTGTAVVRTASSGGSGWGVEGMKETYEGAAPDGVRFLPCRAGADAVAANSPTVRQHNRERGRGKEYALWRRIDPVSFVSLSHTHGAIRTATPLAAPHDHAASSHNPAPRVSSSRHVIAIDPASPVLSRGAVVLGVERRTAGMASERDGIEMDIALDQVSPFGCRSTSGVPEGEGVEWCGARGGKDGGRETRNRWERER
ncbi:hypothetical protein C8R45DRAFT_920601 [Mycena sanguinolenta]|nr:hypothetical protein C8R45DRAFT_920601 [Mycena sanguinolenta]